MTDGPGEPQLARHLVDHAMALLDEAGSDLSLRAVAARAGVSHAAPAHHFGGLPGLRNAIAIRGFTDLCRDLSRRSPAGSPFQDLLSMAHAYVAFADRRPALFQLMFQELMGGDPTLRRNAAIVYQMLHVARSELAPDSGGEATEVAIFTMVHGYAVMRLSQPRPPGSPMPPVDMAALLRLLVQGDQQPVA